MLKRMGWLFLVLGLLLSAALPPGQATGAGTLTVWTVGTATKIQPTTAPGSG